jgi:predicted aldo/keto reductase-like oxidoreductase
MNLRSFWRRFPAERFFGSGAGFAEAAASAENCVQCGKCEAKCPYNLPIREMLVENADFFRKAKAEWEPAVPA